jgi:hypothetical protein
MDGMMPKAGRRHCLLGLCASVFAAAGVVGGHARLADAQISLGSSQRAADGTVYEVMIVPTGSLSSGVEQVRVTSVAGSVNALAGCSSSGAGSGDPTKALTGVDPAAMQFLHPYTEVTRTTVLTPNDVTKISFNAAGSGKLTIGDTMVAGAVFDICREPGINCGGGATDAAVVGLATADAGVPEACIATGVTAPGCLSGTRTTFGFGLGRNAGTNECVSGLPTAVTTICADRPADGFTVGKGQVIVFMYDGSLGAAGFTIGLGGFGIDTDNSNNPQCPLAGHPNGTVITADAQNPSAPPAPPPTVTPTSTVTNTPTLTPTLTPTNTPTLTPTNTPTLTPTNTPTLTPTNTPTRTPTNTPTRTPTPTPTNTPTPSPQPTPTAPPVPLIPSPTSPSGLLLISGLGLSIAWMLRRAARAATRL